MKALRKLGAGILVPILLAVLLPGIALAADVNPQISVTKHISVDKGDGVYNWFKDGEVLTGTALKFRFIVVNTGNTPVTITSITDDPPMTIHLPKFAGDTENGVGTSGTVFFIPNGILLTVGASITATAEGVALAGYHPDTVTAIGQYSTGGITYTPTATDTASYTGVSPAISVKKWVSVDNGNTFYDANDASEVPFPQAWVDDPVVFRFQAHNSGDVDLTDVTITDNIYGPIAVIAVLEAGAYSDYFYVDSTAVLGEHTNIATVTGNWKDRQYSDEDPATYIGNKRQGQDPTPAISLVKYIWDSASGAWVFEAPWPEIAAGETVSYMVVVTNTGTTLLTDFVLQDKLGDNPPFVIDSSDIPDQLAPGESFSVEFQDIAIASNSAMDFSNTTDIATVWAKFGDEMLSASDTAAYFGNCITPEQLCTYTKGGYANNGGPGKILNQYYIAAFPNGLMIGDYQGANGKGLYWQPNGTGLTNLKAFLLGGGPSGALKKDALNPDRKCKDGGTLATQIATLTINVGLSALPGSGVPGGIGGLIYSNPSDPLNGKTVIEILAIANDALAGKGLPAGYSFSKLNELATSLNEAYDDCIEMPWAKNFLKYCDSGVSPALSVTKWVSVDNGATYYDANDASEEPFPQALLDAPVSFMFQVHNTGNVDLSDVTITDNVYGLIASIDTLAAGALSDPFFFETTAVLGTHTNIATVTGYWNAKVYTAQDPATYIGIESSGSDLIPGISIVKSVWSDAANGWVSEAPWPEIAVGETVSYKVVVTNTGTAPLTDIVLQDKLGNSTPFVINSPDIPDLLAPGAFFTVEFEDTAIASNSKQDLSNTTDIATVWAQYEGEEVSASDTAAYFGSYAAPLDFCSYTKGGYANNGTPGKILNQYYTAAFPNGLMIGDYQGANGKGLYWQANATGLANLKAFLLGGGPSGALKKDVLNPDKKCKDGGTLATQVATLTINVGLSALPGSGVPGGFGGLKYSNPSDPLHGKTVSQILAIANNALAGKGLPAGYSFSKLNDLATSLNEAYDDCNETPWAKFYLKP